MDTMNAYYVTFGWMTNEEALGLKGSELQVYALVHSYSQGEQGCYFGSLDYTAHLCGMSRGTVKSAFKSLVEKGLLRKQEVYINNVKLCQYVALRGGSKIDPVGQNLTGGGVNSDPVGGSKIDPKYKYPLKDNNKGKGGVTQPDLTFPFSSEKFMYTWNALCQEAAWKKKTKHALQLQLNKLGRYEEEFAIMLMERTIESGKWERVVFDNTDEKYQEWKSARQQKIDNAVPRTSQQPQVSARTLAMAERLAKMREQNHGDTD